VPVSNRRRHHRTGRPRVERTASNRWVPQMSHPWEEERLRRLPRATHAALAYKTLSSGTSEP
jgi:hypothetical protein